VRFSLKSDFFVAAHTKGGSNNGAKEETVRVLAILTALLRSVSKSTHVQGAIVVVDNCSSILVIIGGRAA
jgi:hypothetical protein